MSSHLASLLADFLPTAPTTMLHAMARMLVVLFSFTAVLAGCGGKGASESTSLAKLVPDELGGTKLRKESYTGKVWLKARPEVSFAPEVGAEVSSFSIVFASRPLICLSHGLSQTMGQKWSRTE
jgi:hypothetical protein